MTGKKNFENNIFILSIIFLPVNCFWLKFPLTGRSLPCLFMMIGVLFYGFRIIKCRFLLNKFEKLGLFYLFVCCFWQIISTFIGVNEYGYYNLFSLEQTEGLRHLLQTIRNVGVNITDATAIKIWTGLRFIKRCFVNVILRYGISLWVYHLFQADTDRAGLDNEDNGLINRLNFAINILCIILIIYSAFEIGYLRGNQFCRDLLTLVNPLLYEPQIMHGWWPPLLWKNQLRSLFAEPSFFGLGSTFIVPFLFYKILKSKDVPFTWICYAAFTIMLFMTRARTAVLLFIIQIFMLLLYSCGINRKFFRKTIVVLVITVLSFGFALFLMSGFKDPSVISSNTKNESVQETVSNYVGDNVASVVGNKRSNSARFANVRASILTGLQNPVFGVGTGLASAYINANLTEEDLSNDEVKNWSRYMYREGPVNAPFPNLNQFSVEIAQYGIPGLIMYLLPVFYIFQQLLKLKKQKFNTEIACFFIAYIGSCIGMLSNEAFFTYYVLTGIMISLLHIERQERKTGNGFG